MIARIFISLIFLSTVFTSVSQTNNPKNTLPTKSETITWLNNKMSEKPPSSINTDGTVNKVTEWLSLDGKTYYQDLTIYKSLTDVFSKKPKLDNRNLLSVSLSDLNPESLKIRYYKDVFFIAVSTTNSLKKIKLQLPSSDSNEPTSNYETHYNSSFDFGPFSLNKENNLEQRLIKALKHLILLNGGKAEVF